MYESEEVIKKLINKNFCTKIGCMNKATEIVDNVDYCEHHAVMEIKRAKKEFDKLLAKERLMYTSNNHYIQTQVKKRKFLEECNGGKYGIWKKY